MADDLQVNPIDLHLASAHFVTAAQDHATEAARHMGDFNDGIQRWRGKASKAALQEVAARWEARHADHQKQVHALGHGTTEAAQRYTAADGAQTSVPKPDLSL